MYVLFVMYLGMSAGMNVMTGVHIAIALFAIITANAAERSIITKRSNKYLFLGVSIIYSLVVPFIAEPVMVEASHGDSPGYFRFLLFLIVLGFVFVQIIGYDLLNRVTEDD